MIEEVLFNELIFYVMLLAIPAIMLFTYIAYHRFQKGQFKKLLLFIMLAFYSAGFAQLSRIVEKLEFLDTPYNMMLDRSLYVVAALFALSSCYLIYKFSKRYGLKRVRK